jgi:hypothetical protein
MLSSVRCHRLKLASKNGGPVYKDWGSSTEGAERSRMREGTLLPVEKGSVIPSKKVFEFSI